MTCHPYSERVVRCAGLMKTAGLDVLLLAKPANMAYLTGDGRLRAYAMITQEGKVSIHNESPERLVLLVIKTPHPDAVKKDSPPAPSRRWPGTVL